MSRRRRRAVFKKVKQRKRINQMAAKQRKKLEAAYKLKKLLERRRRLHDAHEYLDYRRYRQAIKDKQYYFTDPENFTARRADRRRSVDWNDHYRNYREINKRTNGSVAARSARTQSVPPPTKPWKKVTSKWMTSAQLAALNKRRKKTRNSWTHDPCVERPDSKRAAELKHNGKGKGGYTPRKWC